MTDTLVTDLPCCLGLSVEEQGDVRAGTRSLPLGWSVAFETTDSDETYARVIPPWIGGLSAFLIDREAHGVILTDNISEGMRPVINVMDDTHDAIERVVAVVSGRVQQRAALARDAKSTEENGAGLLETVEPAD